MRYSRRIQAAAVLMIAAAVAAAPNAIMGRSYENRAATAVFVAAAGIFTPSGDFQPEVPDAWRPVLLTFDGVVDAASAQRPASPSPHIVSDAACAAGTWAEADVEVHGSSASLDDRVATATGIFAGRVVSVTPGFFFGNAGSLVELRDVSVIKADWPYARVLDHLYVAHPYAKFRLAGADFCHATDVPLPHVADGVLVFASGQPADADGLLVYATSRDLFIERNDGGVAVSAETATWFRGATTLNAAIARVESTPALRAGPPR